MSRVGKKPIPLPVGVTVTVAEDGTVRVTGPRGSLERRVHPRVTVRCADQVVLVERASDEPGDRALHGLWRSLVANMVEGVTNGFSRSLELVGTGYRASKAGDRLVLAVGYSHPVTIDPGASLAFEVGTPAAVTVRGIDKEAVGAMAARVRSVRPPEPYQGKGIRYSGERVRRKAGKSGKK